MGDEKNLVHTRWNCKYHIVFGPKYRRQAFYGEKGRAIGSILRSCVSEKRADPGIGVLCRSYPYAYGNPAQNERIRLYGVSEREKQSDVV